MRPSDSEADLHAPIRRFLQHRGAVPGMLVAASILSACAMSDEKLSRLIVAPDKFTLYNCSDLALKAKELATRESELTQLMARAEQDAGGRLVSTLSYKTDYAAVRGEMDEIRKTAAEKNCQLPQPSQATTAAAPARSAR
jgi:hypothetical protein